MAEKEGNDLAPEELKRVMRALGKRGGPARWKGVSKEEERSRLMRKAVRARWAKRKKPE